MVTFIFFRICLGIPVSVHWWGQLLRFAQKDQQQTPMISIVYLVSTWLVAQPRALSSAPGLPRTCVS